MALLLTNPTCNVWLVLNASAVVGGSPVEEANLLFCQEVTKHANYWVQFATNICTGYPDTETTWRNYDEPAAIMRQILIDKAYEDAFKSILFGAVTGFAHSVLATLDGATELAGYFTLDVITSDGRVLGPGLKEMFFEYLTGNGLLPYGDHTT
jgi:hypothetical protein